MANVLQLNKSQVFTGLGTLTYTVPTTGTYSVGGQVTVPQAFTTGDGAGSNTGLGSGAGGGDAAGFAQGGISGTTGGMGEGFGPVANLYPQPPLYGSNQTSGPAISTGLTLVVNQNGSPVFTAPVLGVAQSAFNFKSAFQFTAADVITVVIGDPLSLSSSNNTRLAVASTGTQSGTVTFSSVLYGDYVTVSGQQFIASRGSNFYTINTSANTSSALNGLYLDLYEGANGGTAVRIWYSTAGVGTAPATPAGGRLVNINLANNDTAIAVATKTAAAFSTSPGATIYVSASGTTAVLGYANITAGPTIPPNMQTSTFVIGTSRQGMVLAPNQFNSIASPVAWAAAASLASQINTSPALSGIYSSSSNSVVTVSTTVAPLNGITSNIFIQQGY